MFWGLERWAMLIYYIYIQQFNVPVSLEIQSSSISELFKVQFAQLPQGQNLFCHPMFQHETHYWIGFFFNCESINITDPNLPSYSHILGHNCSIVSHHLLYKCVYTFCFSLINCSCQNWSDLSLKSDLTPTTWFQKFKWE